MDFTRTYLTQGQNLNFLFKQNKNSFFVEEIAAERFKEKGNFFILKIKKTNTSTWELLEHISKTLKIDQNIIGYAGLKDKNATTIQYISLPLNRSRDYSKLNTKNIKVLETFKHDKKLKIGDLKGNKFKIILENLTENELGSFYKILGSIQKHGIPNYFGHQRFGIDNDFKKAKAVAYGDIFIKDKNLQKFLTAAYQSYLFNAWLSARVQLAKEQNLKKISLLKGDIINEHKIITGLMPGRNTLRSKEEARNIEEKFDDPFLSCKGFRRDAWIVPQNFKNNYIKEQNQMILEFTLPKSSYATVVVEALSLRIF